MSDGAGDAAPHDRRAARRETYRKQLTNSIGGWTGMIITALPTAVFVIVDAITSLRPAIYAAVGTAVALMLYRLARKQPIQQAISGLFAVLIAALIAGRTGEARGYFLLGIWTSFVYAVPFAISVVVRRPLVGLLWEYLDPAPDDPDEPGRKWYRRRPLFRAYMIATLIGTGMFLARGIVQATLYHENATGWLAVAKVVMGTPLYVGCVIVAYWLVRRVRREIAAAARGPAVADGEPAQPPKPREDSAADRAADRRFGLG
jgi:MFS family permease